MKRNVMYICLSALLFAMLTGCGENAQMSEQVYFVKDMAEKIEPEVSMPAETPASEVSEENAASENEDSLPALSEEEVSPVIPEPAEVKVIMVGDVLLHTPVAQGALTEDGNYDFNHLFAHVTEDIAAADIALVNQEVILGGTELGISGYPAFNAPYELGDALMNAGFNVVLHATNHAMDKGKKGLLNCMNFWETQYPETAVLGIHKDEESSRQIYLYEQDDIKIAILNYTYGTNGIALPSDMPYAVDLLEEKRVREDLALAEEMADFTIVCPHWGTEYTLTQTANQKKWAKLFAEGGADLVIATHPHVIEPICWWVKDADGKWSESEETPAEDDENSMLVYYSLGNFVNWTSGTGDGVANRMVGGMAQVTIAKREDGSAAISEWGVKPLVSHVEKGFGAVTVYPLEEYTAELGEKNEIRKQDGHFSYEYCLQLVKQVFGPELDE